MLAPFVQVVDEKLEQLCGIPIETELMTQLIRK
jgi:hypothetical protein